MLSNISFHQGARFLACTGCSYHIWCCSSWNPVLRLSVLHVLCHSCIMLWNDPTTDLQDETWEQLYFLRVYMNKTKGTLLPHTAPQSSNSTSAGCVPSYNSHTLPPFQTARPTQGRKAAHDSLHPCPHTRPTLPQRSGPSAPSTDRSHTVLLACRPASWDRFLLENTTLLFLQYDLKGKLIFPCYLMQKTQTVLWTSNCFLLLISICWPLDEFRQSQSWRTYRTFFCVHKETGHNVSKAITKVSGRDNRTSNKSVVVKHSSLKEQEGSKESWPEQWETFQIFSNLSMIYQTHYLEWEGQMTKLLTLLLHTLFPVDCRSRWSYWFLLAL